MHDVTADRSDKHLGETTEASATDHENVSPCRLLDQCFCRVPVHCGIHKRHLISRAETNHSVDRFVEEAGGIDLERRRAEMGRLDAGNRIQVPGMHDLDLVTSLGKIDSPLKGGTSCFRCIHADNDRSARLFTHARIVMSAAVGRQGH